MPTVAGPPSTSHSSAGAEGSSRPTGSSTNRRRAPRAARPRRPCSSRRHALVGIERHLLDEPQPQSALDRPREQGGRVVEGLAHRDGVELDRAEARAVRGVDAGEHGGQPVAAGQPGEVLAVDRVERDVHPAEPGLDERPATLSSPMPFVVIDSGMPGAAADASAMISTRSARVSGSPPVKRTSWTPRSLPAMPTSRAISAADSRSSCGMLGQSLRRHAVGAAQRALLGDRDAQVAGDAAEPVDEPRGVGAARRSGALDGTRRIRGIPSESVDMPPA